MTEKLIDRIKGAIFGHALGDAAALPTKFRFKKDITNDEIVITLPYAHKIKDYPINDWTSCTDLAIIIMQELTSCNGNLEFSDGIASRMSEYVLHGFPDLGDEKALGVSGTTSYIITNTVFATDPLSVATATWEQSGKTIAFNDSLSRTSVIGAIPDPKKACEIAVNISTLTHVDPRCLASCFIQSAIIHHLIYFDYTDDKNTNNDDDNGEIKNKNDEPVLNIDEMLCSIIAGAKTMEPSIVENETELSEWIQRGYTGKIADLELDSVKSVSYVYKCLACSMYALQIIKTAIATTDQNVVTPSFKKVIKKIALEGGDSCANTAVTGAILGAYLGYSKLPTKWLAALPNKEWLDDIANNYISMIVESLSTTKLTED